MISAQNTTSNGAHAAYAIAQFTPDLFRREPKNVGVMVEKSGYVAAQFVGETPETDGATCECGRRRGRMASLNRPTRRRSGLSAANFAAVALIGRANQGLAQKAR